METRNKRIASFIETLGCEEISSESQSFLLTADMDAIGGANGGNCQNANPDSCTLNSHDCRNIGDCSNTDNKGNCKNDAGDSDEDKEDKGGN